MTTTAVAATFFQVGFTFSMGAESTSVITYRIESINESTHVATCTQTNNNNNTIPFPATIYLQQTQLQFVTAHPNANTNTSTAINKIATLADIDIDSSDLALITDDMKYEDTHNNSNDSNNANTVRASAYDIGFQFSMNNRLCYKIVNIIESANLCLCEQITDPNSKINLKLNSDFPTALYLHTNQMQFVTAIENDANEDDYEHPMAHELPLITAATANANANSSSKNREHVGNDSPGLNGNGKDGDDNDTNAINDYGSMQTFQLTDDVEEQIQSLAAVLPYFSDFVERKEKSVVQMNNFKNDPQQYLQAILDKYNVEHPKTMNDTQSHPKEYELRPWIEGVLQKLMPQANILGQQNFKTRLFRLFDEALVWFEDTSGFFKKMFSKQGKKTTMKPFGVLPLAMITGLKTADIFNKADNEVTEDELLRLELEIGGADAGVIVLKCADFNQRIKWFECLHTAIFTVERPMFTKKKNIWKIAEEGVDDENRRLSTADLGVRRNKTRKLMRMGTSLVLNLGPRTSLRGDNLFGSLGDLEMTNEDENMDENIAVLSSAMGVKSYNSNSNHNKNKNNNQSDDDNTSNNSDDETAPQPDLVKLPSDSAIQPATQTQTQTQLKSGNSHSRTRSLKVL